MSKLQFDQEGQRFYETGVDHGVLFVKNINSGFYLAESTTVSKKLILKKVNAYPASVTADDMKYLFAKVEDGAITEYKRVTEEVSGGVTSYSLVLVTMTEVEKLPSEMVKDNVYCIPSYKKGVAWNGLISVTQSPEGAEAEDIYADNIKYLTLISNETFGGTITAYTYPDEFNECDGNITENGVSLGQQTRTAFALAYRTIKSNDEGDEKHKLHIIYGAKAAPSEREYSTVNDSPEAMELSWEINTTPIVVDETITVNGKPIKPISHIEIDETANKDLYDEIEAEILGSDSDESYLPMPEEIIAQMNQ